ncbi:L,D-transpeptidase family protein [Microvirga arsenatis]|uniref:L,D-transpeptidase family protein n=1 Tax=Microvirga arsenatis TaxID=2692265 RepID=A0ABW9YY28_9HYPH|nr:murein L,D-transpeptidase family protein [Microvirga arsenatis]NBJ10702.1 L,D-transpeptidase family protein [Microvirga arsenatis]NBJ24400.1 L,D-transpeptidase family protein [Microvirga arsenatis]
MNSARGVLSGVILAAALAGCVTVGDPKHLKPVPPKLVASMQVKGMTVSDPILIRVFKKEAELEVWKRDATGQYALLKIYPVCRWSGQLGPKMQEGDRQTPEGFYTVRAGQMNPNSAYYLSFDLGFPNELDRALGRTGSALMIHGACSSSGCFAMTDDGAAELFALAREAIKGGQEAFQVQSFPFRMTPENLAEHRASPHIAFWRNLKEGSDHFEATRRPPTVASCGKRYVFNARPNDPGGRFGAGAACPAFTVEAGAAMMVAAKQARDEARIREIVASGRAAVSYTYADGSMHPSFQELLRRSGPARLQALTSGRVEVSRPETALAEPKVTPAGPAPAWASGTTRNDGT